MLLIHLWFDVHLEPWELGGEYGRFLREKKDGSSVIKLQSKEKNEWIDILSLFTDGRTELPSEKFYIKLETEQGKSLMISESCF